MNAIEMRRFARRTDELRAAVQAGRYLREDAEASAIARKFLRKFDDLDLASIKYLSAVNLEVVCHYFDCSPHILFLARAYERARRRAFPQPVSNDAGGAVPRSTGGLSGTAPIQIGIAQ